MPTLVDGEEIKRHATANASRSRATAEDNARASQESGAVAPIKHSQNGFFLAQIFVIALALATPNARPAVAATSPSGFHSTGTLVAAATISGSPLNVGGNIALYRRGSMYRLDLLSLSFPGAGSTAGAVAGALLAPGGATLIFNGDTGSVTAYANGNRTYYQDGPKRALASPAPLAASGRLGAVDPLATLATIARQLHDMQRAAIQFTGHSITNGHPTDDIDVLVQRQRPGKPLEDYHAQVALADDLDGFPVRIALSSTPPTPQDFGGSLRLDLTAIAREDPDITIFAVPSGYTRVKSIGDVLQSPR